ncbi:hypothetical protein JCGZ_03538 [Jatropha curcas]|uniref:Major facilitator superfamily (MFS) profile domain-containing protein n=1 Tax=Jatropha curcas TaxID=180498 RepID=A0A067LD81_JATCU|nr:hypothetical protein JCGZ_03538 [Jatropha curcas]
MAGGGFVAQGGGKKYEGGVTPFVIMTCLVAAMGGLIFGYDIGISGGVTSMNAFLEKFFPSVYKKETETHHENMYCKFESHLLQLFTSSLYVAALVASFLASMSVPVYLSEMAPAQLRGALNIGFQMAITLGILAANLINYGTAKIKGGWGWRVSLALAAVPAIMIIVGSLFLPDTPNSILERGHPEKAKAMLRKIRGTDNVEYEFQDLVEASEAAKRVQNPWRNIMQPKYRPQLVICTLVPFFQQLTGINVIMFYAPVLFKTLGFGDDASLMSAVITGVVNVLATLVSVYCADKFGRRALFLQGGAQMIICQVLVGIMIATTFGTTGVGKLSGGEANFVLSLICLYVAAFAWSWGPLGWLVPSEICSLEIRSAGQAINVCVNMFFTFVIGQFFLSMLCHMKFGLFLFFAGFVILMTLFVFFFLPETKNVPIEEMNRLWKAHWFWGQYIPDEGVSGGHPFGDQSA